jgi:hypothetical protein
MGYAQLETSLSHNTTIPIGHSSRDSCRHKLYSPSTMGRIFLLDTAVVCVAEHRLVQKNFLDWVDHSNSDDRDRLQLG